MSPHTPHETLGLLTAPEAIKLVSSLQPFTIPDIGSIPWMQQHAILDKLNIQAHYDAQLKSKELVKDALMQLGKVSTLVQNALAIEAWTDYVHPLLDTQYNDFDASIDPSILYSLLYNEVTLANLLQVIIHHQDVAQALDEEAAIELCDWCSRKLLVMPLKTKSNTNSDDDWREEAKLSTMTCALTILRHMADHMDHLSLGILSRMVSTNDVVGAVVHLLQSPPWERINPDTQLQEVFHGGEWVVVKDDVGEYHQQYKLPIQEAQAWLLLNTLLTDPMCLVKMDLSSRRQEELVHLRCRLMGPLMEQLPILTGLRRALEEMAMGALSDPESLNKANATSCVVIEHVPMMRRRLLEGQVWQEIADKQKTALLLNDVQQVDAIDSLLTSISSGLDFLPAVVDNPFSKEKHSSNDDKPQLVKLDVYAARKNSLDTWEWHSTVTLEIRSDIKPELISVPVGFLIREASSRSCDQHNSDVAGERYRLTVASCSGQECCELPAQGKMVVRHKSHTCEASYTLPSAQLRNGSDVPEALWLTVGSIVDRGMALQLKVKIGKATHRDESGWLVYHPAGGALTLKRT